MGCTTSSSTTNVEPLHALDNNDQTASQAALSSSSASASGRQPWTKDGTSSSIRSSKRRAAVQSARGPASWFSVKRKQVAQRMRGKSVSALSDDGSRTVSSSVNSSVAFDTSSVGGSAAGSWIGSTSWAFDESATGHHHASDHLHKSSLKFIPAAQRGQHRGSVRSTGSTASRPSMLASLGELPPAAHASKATAAAAAHHAAGSSQGGLVTRSSSGGIAATSLRRVSSRGLLRSGSSNGAGAGAAGSSPRHQQQQQQQHPSLVSVGSSKSIEYALRVPMRANSATSLVSAASSGCATSSSNGSRRWRRRRRDQRRPTSGSSTRSSRRRRRAGGRGGGGGGSNSGAGEHLLTRIGPSPPPFAGAGAEEGEGGSGSGSNGGNKACSSPAAHTAARQSSSLQVSPGSSSNGTADADIERWRRSSATSHLLTPATTPRSDGSSRLTRSSGSEAWLSGSFGDSNISMVDDHDIDEAGVAAWHAHIHRQLVSNEPEPWIDAHDGAHVAVEEHEEAAASGAESEGTCDVLESSGGSLLNISGAMHVDTVLTADDDLSWDEESPAVTRHRLPRRGDRPGAELGARYTMSWTSGVSGPSPMAAAAAAAAATPTAVAAAAAGTKPAAADAAGTAPVSLHKVSPHHRHLLQQPFGHGSFGGTTTKPLQQQQQPILTSTRSMFPATRQRTSPSQRPRHARTSSRNLHRHILPDELAPQSEFGWFSPDHR